MIKGYSLYGITVNVENTPDLVPVLAVIAAYAKGTTHIIGAGRLRFKESNRLKTIAQTLNALGAVVSENEEGLTITGQSQLMGGRVDLPGQNSLGAGHGDGGYLAAQLVLGPAQLLLDLGAAGSDLAIPFPLTLALGLFDDIVGAAVGRWCVSPAGARMGLPCLGHRQGQGHG